MANVLVIGMSGLAAEVCKNIVLAGVKSLTVMDTTHLAGEDVGNRFLRIKDGENVRQLCYESSTCIDASR